MPLWIEWLRNNWLSIMLTAGVIVAIIYVITKRKMLFYKD